LPDVLFDEADEPAAEVPAEVAAKLPAMAGVVEQASRAKIRIDRIIGGISLVDAKNVIPKPKETVEVESDKYA
jgi:hypothetical protein